MKNTIRLDSTHPDKARAEHFLNKIDAELQEIPFDPRQLSGVDDRIAGFKFRVKGRSTCITVIFTESYTHAMGIEAANAASKAAIQWTINGALLFGVEFVEGKASGDLLSFFAGRE